MKLSNLLLPAMLLASSSAIAADAVIYSPEPAPVMVESFSWTGGYVGIHGGYGWGDTRDVANPDADRKDIDGALGGLQAGYNFQFDNNIVLGVEADISLASIDERWEDSNINSGYYTEDRVEAVGTLRARLGYAVDRFLPYLTGGLAIGKMEHILGCDPDLTGGPGSCASDPNRVFEDKSSSTNVGYTIGGGAEYAFTNNWSFKAEYLYTDLGKETVTLVDPAYPDLDDRKFDTSFHAIRVGLNYRF